MTNSGNLTTLSYTVPGEHFLASRLGHTMLMAIGPDDLQEEADKLCKSLGYL